MTRTGTLTALRWILSLLDIPVLLGGLLLAYEFRFYSDLIPLYAPIPDRNVYVKASALVSFFWFLVLAVSGVYRDRLSGGVEEILGLVKALVRGSVLALAAAFLYRGYSFSRVTVLLAILFCAVLLGLFHVLKMRLFEGLWRRRIGINRCLLVGDGELATSFYSQFRAQETPAMHFIGFVAEEGDRTVGDLPRLGHPDEIVEVIRDHFIHHVVVAIPSTGSMKILEIIDRVSSTSAGLTLIPDLYSIIATSVTPGDLVGIPSIRLSRLPIHGIGGQVKYALDGFLAAVALVLLSPVMTLIACLVRRDSPGPVFHVQERVGLDGRSFRMYKFRSMAPDAENKTGPIWAEKNDPRCTRVGAFLRKYSLDELPQLFNVLRGEMSLVGPRPERPPFVERFKASIPHYISRHKVRSGMTGWAQISGLRGRSPIEERTRYDIWYIENWSLWLDLRILLKTIRVVLFQPTGY